MAELSLTLQKQIAEMLIGIEPAEGMETLRTDGTQAIKSMIGCSEQEAGAILKHFEDRGFIEPQVTTRGGTLDQRALIPQVRFKWGRAGIST